MPVKPRRTRKVKKVDRSLNPLQKRAVRKIAKKELDSREEFKQFSKSVAATPVTDGVGGEFLSQLTEMTQNVGDNARVGDEVYISSIKLQCLFSMQTGVNSTEFCHFRLIVFQYKAHDDTPSISELLLTSNLNGGTTYGTYSAYNIDYKPIYHVLLDKVVRCEYGVPNASNYGNTGLLTQHKTYNIPLKYAKRKIQFKSASTNANNAIWLLVTTNLGNITSNPVFGYQCSIRYTDS